MTAKTVSGVSVSPGLAMGYVKKIKIEPFARTGKQALSPREEYARFVSARENASNDFKKLAADTVLSMGTEHGAIFETHALMAQDPMLADSVKAGIDAGMCAPDALVDATLAMKSQFDVLPDEYFRERAKDVLDIGYHIFKILTGAQTVSNLPAGAVLVTETVPPSDVALLKSHGVIAAITEQGGPTSHYAILMKALQIPGISGVNPAVFSDGDFVLCDGETGHAEVNPAPNAKAAFEARMIKQRDAARRLAEQGFMPSVTRDGTHVGLWGNIASLGDAIEAKKADCTGIGLFRTEFLFMHRASAPPEDEQYEAYRATLEAMAPHPVIIRTLDAGGDKEVPYLKEQIGAEGNPFLGKRAIRICLDDPNLFRAQLRALARASVHGNLMIMLPMISSLWEIRETRNLLDQVIAELRDGGHKVADSIPLGIMIEIPAAAMMIDVLAREADFFSVGTNDLVQYTLAVDRQNPGLSKWYDPYHPAVIRLLASVASEAQRQGRPLSMCGEMSGDRLAIPLLVAMGFDHLSMSASRTAWAKDTIRQLDTGTCKELLAEVLDMGNGYDIKARLMDFQKNMEN